jgi:hypothetical protein
MNNRTLLFSLILATTACGDRIVSIDPDGGPTLIDMAGISVDAQLVPLGDAQTPPSACVIALRVDDCCTAATAHSQSAVDADPCLVEWQAAGYYPAIPPACEAKWSKDCALIDCIFTGPPSRIVAPKDGTCQFVDECQTAADCVLATRRDECCGCPNVYPAALLKQDNCLVKNGEAWGPTPEECSVDCLAEECSPCFSPTTFDCVVYDDSDKPRRCVATP